MLSPSPHYPRFLVRASGFCAFRSLQAPSRWRPASSKIRLWTSRMTAGTLKLRNALETLFKSYADAFTSPLCVEEFDISDRNFRPCPCGYQVNAAPSSPSTPTLRVDIRDSATMEKADDAFLIGLSILLPQHQEQHERTLPRMPADL